MAHQESVLSSETDILILMSARPYTAITMTLCKSVYENAFLSLCACTDFRLHACERSKFRVKRCQLARWHLGIQFIIEVGKRRKERGDLRESTVTNEGVNFLSPSSQNRSVVTVGGVGLSEASSVVMKTVSQKTQTGCRPLIDQGNFI